MRTASNTTRRVFGFPVTLLGWTGLAASVLVALFAAALPSARAAEPDTKSADGAARTVLITGANRGIGLELARQYHAAGWNVLATARKPDEATELHAMGKGVRVLALDVLSGESVAALAKTLDKQPIDLLINNAGVGVGLDPKTGLEKIKIEDYERVIQTNTIGPVRVTQALLPNLRMGKGKTIVGMSSGLGSIAQNTKGGYYGYRESKAALDMFTRNIAAELKDEGFVCIAIIPGWVKTDMGGPNATLTPEESVSGMRKVIDALKPEDNGKFWSYDGTIVPW